MLNLSQAWANLKVYELSIESLKKAIALNSKDTDKHKFLMVKLLIQLQKFESAL